MQFYDGAQGNLATEIRRADFLLNGWFGSKLENISNT